eukprot:CAMPEP_0198563690 /NCGR_PEP_ID=MMETSP1462-20131121/99142_1 /TAXON_ID=1333877 /ORGANISM="Brandtodinium nutriculum, Strain RCC3387" /LENGTH=127 /DNA_ID=CAMNT_0044294641 /DNA_START=13 /DNA_END=396 /DNA_ORIENTATION=-
MGNFVPVSVADPVLQTGTRLVCAEAGDLILWDSRCVHCNTPGVLEEEDKVSSDELLRLASYVCMTPAAWACEETLALRRQAFVRNMVATHIPHEMHDLEAGPEWMAEKDWDRTPELQRHLIVGKGGE